MGKIIFTLEKTMKELDITGNKLAVESKVRPDTVYKMMDNDASRLNLDTLLNILDALNRIAKEKDVHRDFTLEDVLIYIK